MYPNYSNSLLDLEGVSIKKIIHADSFVKIFIETKKTTHICPHCGQQTSRVHDYRLQEIKDLPFQLKHVILVLRKRRYSCSCGKRIPEQYDFLPHYQRRTRRLSFMVVNLLSQTLSVKQVAAMTGLSVTTVTRILDSIHYSEPDSLPACLSIDEFKGNADTGKYQCILVDSKKHQILDILPRRSQAYLVDYMRKIPRKEREKVRFFVCDMWKPYVEMATALFPNATIIIDKYHFVRQVTWAIEKVRKNVQKKMDSKLRRYYKRSRKLILARYKKLNEENKKACDLMLLYNEDLRQAHRMKEAFYEICKMEKYREQQKAFDAWVSYAEKSGITEFEKCASTFRHWRKGILNAFKYGYTNGTTEGFNNRIKVLKRTSYGIRNFERFRTRILHMTTS